MKNSKIKVIDIGHRNLNLYDAQSLLETTISQIAHEGRIKAIKIITGHGSGALRRSVRKWLIQEEGRFQAVINGEDYDMFNTIAIDMRSACLIKNDYDFGRSNSGITFVWLW